MNEIKQSDDLLGAIARVLIRCFVMGIALMVLWLAILVLAGDFTYSVHSRLIPIPRQQFDSVQYVAIAVTKGCIFLFFLLPYIAIRLGMRRRQ